jgi:phenylacetate-coenzyme A ligase PaaK-like adenylate-forming protein
MYSNLLTKIVYPILQIKYPMLNNTIKNLKILNKTQWSSSSEIEHFQHQRLQLLLTYAYENVPYYHKIFNTAGLKPTDIKNNTDLKKLPILTKDIIRNNLHDLLPKNLKNRIIPTATGGSTGEPMKFFIDDNWLAWNQAAAYRQWSWADYNIGDKIVYLWSAPQDISFQSEMINKIFNTFHRTLYLDSLQLTEKTLDNYIKKLRSYKPKIINAYASAIDVFAQHIEKRGITDIRPKAILTSCEMLFPYQRKTIEHVFDCNVYDYYSGRDTTFQAGECSEHIGYHMAIENAVVEFLKYGEPVSLGEDGKMIITDLENFAMPFIRYEIGDLGRLSDEKCPCGRNLPLIKEISGRIRDIIITKDGKYINGAFFSMLFYDKKGMTKGIKQYQFIQKTNDFSILKLVKDKDFSQEELNKIIEKIHEQCGDMDIEIEFVDFILPTKSGKYRSVLSEVEIHI